MSDERDEEDGVSRFKSGNVDENGDYIVGKNRPPSGGQFRANDGRKRGRRAKGTRNRKTEFRAMLEEKVTLVENGKKRRVTKRRAADAQLIDGAIKGKPASQRVYYDQLGKLLDGEEIEQPKLSAPQRAILEDFARLFDAGFAAFAGDEQSQARESEE